MKFPEDFTVSKHPTMPGGKQWILKKDNEVIISIVGGDYGVYGDGVDTFEMWDYREDMPRGYLTKDAINIHLENNPIN